MFSYFSAVFLARAGKAMLDFCGMGHAGPLRSLRGIQALSE